MSVAVEEYMGLARSVAWKYIPKSPGDPDDILSDAMLGLVKAGQKFDPAMGYHFNTYAVHCIRGEILSGLRNRQGNRTDYALIKRAMTVRYQMAARDGQFPTSAATAQALGVSADKLGETSWRWRASRPRRTASIGEQIEGTNFTVGDTIPDPHAEEEMLSFETRDLVADLLPQLTSQQHMVVALYYWDDMTMCEIGKVLEVTESRTSQILSQARERLRRLMLEADSDRKAA